MARISRRHLQTDSTNQKPIEPTKRYIAGIYARTSSDDQKGDSIENQENICKQFIESTSDIKLHRIYIDYGLSSFARIRPGFNNVLFDVESKKINCVVVKDFSRLSRDYFEASNLIQKVFPSWGIRLISVTDGFDSLHSDETKIEIALRSLLNNYYSIDLSNKIQSVINVRQKSGTYVPARLPYGYTKVKTAEGVKWQPDEKEAPIVKKIFASALNGLSAYRIASDLNKHGIIAPSSDYWASSSVLRLLRNTSYVGTFTTGKTRNNKANGFKTEQTPSEEWIRHYKHHTAIIDDITFYFVQRILSQRTTMYVEGEKRNEFFRGKLYCGVCGRKMRSKRAGNGSIYYLCPRRDEAASSCVSKSIREAKLKKQVFTILGDWMNSHKEAYSETLAFESSPYFQRTAIVQKEQLQLLQNELERQNSLFRTIYEDGINKSLTHSADYRELMTYLRKVRSVLTDEIVEIEKVNEDYLKTQELIIEKYHLCVQFQDCIELTSDMLDDVVEKIYVDLDGLRVNYKD
jgi:DNA invertase Pin-like site-specific DNA recombinase